MGWNDVFVQRGIRAVKLWQLSVGAILHINTVVILLGDVWKFERSLLEPDVLKVNEFLTEPLSVEGKYAVKLSITELVKLVGNEGNVIMVAYGKCKCGLTPTITHVDSSTRLRRFPSRAQKQWRNQHHVPRKLKQPKIILNKILFRGYIKYNSIHNSWQNEKSQNQLYVYLIFCI